MIDRRGVRPRLDAVRRRSAMLVDRTWARVPNRVTPTRAVPFDGDARFALITVNFSTTRYLKLMLLTLSEQASLSRLGRVIVVDNGSRDGAESFLQRLERVPGVHVVRRRHRLHHGPAMRAGVRALDRIDAGDVRPANVLLFCDTDVIFRDQRTLGLLGEAFDGGAALAGEIRPRREGADIQASFFAVRRDVAARRDVAPLVHDGAPARRQQASIWRLGLTVADFPSNRGGFVLHRGRTGVAAAAALHPNHAYASAARAAPHFMGVPDGAAIWQAVEDRWAELLDPAAEDRLTEELARRMCQRDDRLGA
jgi:Glycosyl transferase family 2